MRTTLRFAALLALGLITAACGSGERETDIAAREGIILIGNGGEPQTLDPHIATGNPERKILGELLEGLVNFDPSNLEVFQPGVAESWESNEGLTLWTFHLREDARFSNGDPVTAQDFIYSWSRFLSPELGAQDSSYFYHIRNSEAYNLGQIDDFSQVGVSAPDDYTLVVELSRPDPTFLYLVSGPTLAPLSQRAIEAHGSSTDRQNPWTTVENFVGNGPFVMTDWRTNQVLEMRKSENYWNADAVALNGARWYPIENLNTEENLFLDGRLHVTGSIPPDRVPVYIEEDLATLVREPALRPYFYMMNVAKPPLDDVRVRQALSYAIDRELLVDRVTRGGETAATGYMPPGYPGYETAEVLDYDLDRARELLAEAGYPNGEGFPHFEILINTSESHSKIAQAIQEMWRTGLGIDVGIYNQEWRVYLDAILGSNFDMVRASLVQGPDQFGALEAFRTGGSRNLGNWDNTDFNRLIRSAETEGDLDRRTELLQDAEAVMLQDLPVIPLFWAKNNFLRDTRVQGWTPNPYGQHPLEYVSFSGGVAE